MNEVYPVYLFDKEDFSFREFSCEGDLFFCEKPEIIEGLYEGWDSRGHHFRLEWDEQNEAPKILLDRHESLGVFLQTVDAYENVCNALNINFSLKHDNKHICSPDYLRAKIAGVGEAESGK